jgi:glutamate racemase
LIGIFDSGVGGLSVWREIVKLFPHEHLIYLADQAHVPYGARSLGEVRALTERCASWLIERGCNPVVIACNTASSAALDQLRNTFPATAFVGMEPAVKPAALQTHSGVVGVLATATTFTSPRYADLIRRHAGDVRVIERACLGWVEFVERGGVCAKPDRAHAGLDTGYVTSLLREDADVIVLGCTHFPFLIGAISGEVERWRAHRPDAARAVIIDPAPAVAQQTLRVHERLTVALASRDPARQQLRCAPRQEFWTTGDSRHFATVASELLGMRIAACRLDF